jgi:hypothetical protein
MVAVAAVAALAVAALAAAERPVIVPAGGEERALNGGFAPSVLSKSDPTPIALHLSSRITTADGSPPPALQELVIETDKAGAINLEGLPVCGPLVQDGRDIREDCKSALIGSGTARFVIAFPEEPPVFTEGKLTIFNGVDSRRSAVLYALVDLGGPNPGRVIAKVKVTKVHSGRFGTKAVVSIPKVAGGSGALTSFDVTIFRKFTYKGQRRSALTLTCPDGKAFGLSHLAFEDGSKSEIEVIRTCASKAPQRPPAARTTAIR